MTFKSEFRNGDDSYGINVAAVRELLPYQTSCMEKVFGQAEAQYGSMMGFIQQGIGLTDEEVEKLRSMYLE
jgi:hypothetical protein